MNAFGALAFLAFVGVHEPDFPAEMLFQGMAGFHRRWYDGGKFFEGTSERAFWEAGTWMANLFNGGEAVSLRDLNHVMTYGAFVLAVGQIPFVLNLFGSILWGRKIANDNPWQATTLEW